MEKDIVDFLIDEYEERKKSNLKYSKRAFARDLNIQSGTLSHLLNRKRPISTKLQKNLSSLLNLDEKTLQDLTQKNDSDIKRFQHIDAELFNDIADWTYDALLELTRTKSFKSNPEYIARKLNITKEQTLEAIKKLLKLKLLERMPNGRLLDRSGDNLSYGWNVTDAAKKEYQLSVLEKAFSAVKSIPKNYREQNSTILAINSKDMEEVRKKIKAFAEEISIYTQRPHRELDEVYILSISFFPISVEEHF